MLCLIFSAGILSVSTAELPLGELKLPPRFQVELYAQVENARQMALGDKATVFVGSRNAGKVHASGRN